MSVPSLTSLETAYGSCVGSDGDSILSSRTYRSVRSSSTTFYSGDSDTDTIVNEGDETTSETFYDIVDGDEYCDAEERRRRGVHRGGDDKDHTNSSDEETLSHENDNSDIIASLVEYSLRSSTPVVPITNNTNESPQPSETDRLLDLSNRPPSSNSSSRPIDSDHSTITVQSAYDYQPVVTRIPTGTVCQPIEKPSFKTSGVVHFIYFVILISCSLGYQTALRFNSQLNSWLLVFWRSIFQLVLTFLVIMCRRLPIFGTRGMKLRLFYHAVFGTLSVFAILFSSERLGAKELAGIYLLVPVTSLLLEHLFKRGLQKLHVCLFVLMTWLCSVLLISHNITWPDSNEVNSTNQSTVDSKWQAPFFGLDSLQMWPVQPLVFSHLNRTNDFNQSLTASGIAVGILGLISLSTLPVLCTLSSREIMFQILMWQAFGAALASMTGLLAYNQSFLFENTTDWLYSCLIIALGIVGNLAMVKFLCQNKDGSVRRGWPVKNRYIPGVTIGVVVRASLEIVSIFGINYSAFNRAPVSIEDGFGIGLFLLVGLFCCFVKSSQPDFREIPQEGPMCAS